MTIHIGENTVLLMATLHLIGLITAFFALFQSRTPQGAAAWMLSLIAVPYVSLPLFFLFGQKRLREYHKINIEDFYDFKLSDLKPYQAPACELAVEKFLCSSEHPYIAGNELTLLKDGRIIFQRMLQDVYDAREFILLQMFIFRTDHLGNAFAEALAQKSRQGVKVFVLYENLALAMSSETLKLLKDSGVEFGRYDPGRRSKLYMNFRNHRKLLIVDGKIGHWGGVNIGDDYIGLHEDVGFWRDTNVRVEGPSVFMGQVAFAKDWLWSMNSRLNIPWKIAERSGETSLIVLNSDPGDERPKNLLQHLELINAAKERLWIANAYVVPPQGIIDALLIARIKNIDVRILVPGVTDNPLVAKAAHVYYENLLKAGVRVFRYQKGMMHQKVMLIDDVLARVGSANLDFRSMYINFENGIISNDKKFVADVEAMLLDDFRDSRELRVEDFTQQSRLEKLRSHLANILSPIL